MPHYRNRAQGCQLLRGRTISRYGRAMPSFVYILAAKKADGRTITYVGWTLDLERRLAQHNGTAKGAKSTRGRAWALVYAEKHRTRKGAMRREYVLKHDRAFRALLRE
jgi:putative endonuclease